MSATAGRLVRIGPTAERLVAQPFDLIRRQDGAIQVGVGYLARPGDEHVPDIEGLCRSALVVTIRRCKPTPGLTASEFDDTLRHLIGEVHILAGRYDPRPGRKLRLYLFDRLGKRTIDYWRASWGRHGQHRVRGLFEDDREESGWDSDWNSVRGYDDGAAPVRRSRGAPPDPADDWVDALGGLHATRDREEARPDGILGVVAGQRAARLDPRPGVGESGSARAASLPARAAFVDCPACGWRTYAQAPNGRPGWHIPGTCTGCGAPIADGGTVPPASTVESAGAPHNKEEAA